MNRILLPRVSSLVGRRPQLVSSIAPRLVANFQTTMPKDSVSRRKSAKDETGSRKKKKDPNAPKRSLSAYMFFANDQRETVRAENPNATFGGIGKLLGEKWKQMTASEKEPYEAKANADKKRYEDEKAAYNASRQESD